MADWQLWILAGVGLAVAELVLPAQFLLVALGVCALLVGVLTWGTEMGFQGQLAWFAGMAVALVPVFVYVWRRKSPIRYAGTAGETPHAPQTAEIIATDPLTVRLRGDRFPARATDASSFELGEEVLVERFEGITAQIRKTHPNTP
jgi:membrane protein implicated in regulation of membrane protease activity